VPKLTKFDRNVSIVRPTYYQRVFRRIRLFHNKMVVAAILNINKYWKVWTVGAISTDFYSQVDPITCSQNKMVAAAILNINNAAKFGPIWAISTDFYRQVGPITCHRTVGDTYDIWIETRMTVDVNRNILTVCVKWNTATKKRLATSIYILSDSIVAYDVVSKTKTAATAGESFSTSKEWCSLNVKPLEYKFHIWWWSRSSGSKVT